MGATLNCMVKACPSTCCRYSAHTKNQANMAAAHSAPTMLDAVKLPMANKDSGINGAG